MTRIYRVELHDGKHFVMLDPAEKPPEEVARSLCGRFGRERLAKITRLRSGPAPDPSRRRP